MKKISNALYAPESYIAASPEVRAQVINGCGPGGWKVDLVPDTVYGLSIKEACNIHDWMYAVGTTLEDKKEADRVFLNNCLRLVNEQNSFWGKLLRTPRRARVYNYYLAVKAFGGPAFWSGKNRPENLIEIEGAPEPLPA